MSTTDPTPGTGTRDWQAVEAEPDFRELRRRLRSFVFPVTVAFMAWYLLYVVLAVYASAWMSTPVFGNINIGLIFGLLQFVSTFAITAWYVRWANNRFDPLAEKVRLDIEGSST